MTSARINFIVSILCAVILGTNALPPQKIVNGFKVVGNEFPFLVSLRMIRSDGSYFQFCGGAIISTKHILTAAHCLTNQDPRNIRVFVGTNSLIYGGVDYSLEKVSVHPKYQKDDTYYRYDVAILTLRTALTNQKFSDWKIIRLASRDYPPGTEAVVAGWGDTYFKADMGSTNLQHIHVKLSEFSRCSYGKLREFHLCTELMNGKSTCQGDSGGPLVANGEVIGIVSYGYGCGQRPGAFANVRVFKSFIEQQIGIRM